MSDLSREEDLERAQSPKVYPDVASVSDMWSLLKIKISHASGMNFAARKEESPKDEDAKVEAWIEDPKESAYIREEDDLACSDVFKVYVDEAERYDKGVMESWRSDMNGMLIFSGLFSSILTAFIIESYKTLQAQPEDLTVAFLAQISRQFPSAASDAHPNLDDPMPFQVTSAALICNAFWFVSLALSLTCSLLATLVEQWAREFLHKSELRPAPVRRARVLSFLYLGVQKFGMHVVVSIIPLLLHISLLFFFGGLIAFLLPVNTILACLISAVLGAFVILYTVMTVLPVVLPECPYQTPLTGVLWRYKELIRRISKATSMATTSYKESQRSAASSVSENHHPRAVDVKSVSGMNAVVLDTHARLRLLRGRHHSMAEVVSERASDNSHSRDAHAVKWTLQSLTDDTELLPFIEAIPDAVCGPKGFHYANDRLFIPLLTHGDPQLSISNRTAALLESTLSSDQTLRLELRTRRTTASIKAIWALAMLGSRADQPDLAFARKVLMILESHPKAIYPLRQYTIPTSTALQYTRIKSLMLTILNLRDSIRAWDETEADTWSRAQLCTIFYSHLCALDEHCVEVVPKWMHDWYHTLPFRSMRMNMISGGFHVKEITSWRRQVDTILDRHTAYEIFLRANLLMDLLEACNRPGVDSLPDHFSATCSEIFPNNLVSLIPTILHIPLRRNVVLPLSHGCFGDVMARNSLPCIPLLADRRTQLYMMYRYLNSRPLGMDFNINYILERCDKRGLKSRILDDVKQISHLEPDDPDRRVLLKTVGVLSYHADRIWDSADVHDWYERLFEIPGAVTSASPEVAATVHYALKGLGDALKEIQRDLVAAGSTRTEPFQQTHGRELERLEKSLESLYEHPLIRGHVTVPPSDHWRKRCAVLLDCLVDTRISVVSRIISRISTQADTLISPIVTTQLLCSLDMLQSFDGFISVGTQRRFANAISKCIHVGEASARSGIIGPKIEESGSATGPDSISQSTEVLSSVFEHLSAEWRWLTDAEAAGVLRPALRIYMQHWGIDVWSHVGAVRLANRCDRIMGTLQ